MQMRSEVEYRFSLAQGFLDEARQDLSIQRWRSCVDNSQLAVENSAKAALAVLGPVGKTHDPGAILGQALAAGRFADELRPHVTEIARIARGLGPDTHIQSDYGDETTRQTPWELFAEADAQRALSLAEQAMQEVVQVLQALGP